MLADKTISDRGLRQHGGKRYAPSLLHRILSALAGDESAQAVSSSASDEHRKIAFTFSAIALSAKLARVDGWVNQEEYLAFRALFPMQDSPSQRLRTWFDEAAFEAVPAEYYTKEILASYGKNRRLLEDLVERLFRLANADAPLSSRERNFLKKVSLALGFSAREFAAMLERHTVRKDDPYRVLNIHARAQNEEVRAAYRRLIREYHPDGLQAYGVSAELITLAERKLAAINAAYDTIRRKRGLK